MGNPDKKEHHYGREFLINGLVVIAMLGALSALCSQMSFENYRKRTFPDSTHAIVIQTPLPRSRTTAPTEIPPAPRREVVSPSADCTRYPPLLRHRASACVADDCDGWTFFGKKEGVLPERVIFWHVERNQGGEKTTITCSDPAASQVHAP